MQMQYANPQPARITGDWLEENDPGYEGFVAGYWNGWAVPLLPESQLKKLCADQKKVVGESKPCAELPLLRLEKNDDEDGIGVELFYDEGEDGGSSKVEPFFHEGLDCWLWQVGFGWTWEAELEGDDPASVSEEQRESVEQIRAQFADAGRTISSHSALALDDGTHVFAVCLDLGNKATYGDGEEAREITKLEAIGYVRVAKDGSCSVEREAAASGEEVVARAG